MFRRAKEAAAYRNFSTSTSMRRFVSLACRETVSKQRQPSVVTAMAHMQKHVGLNTPSSSYTNADELSSRNCD